MKLIIAFIIAIISFVTSCQAEGKVLIAINQFVNHISLDAAEKGLQESLLNRKILPDKAQIIFSNAQGNIANSVQISKHHASLKPKFMVAIATPAAQTNLRARQEGTIVAFAAVSDPESAKLIGQENVIGVSDAPAIEELIEQVMRVFPTLKNIGIIYNSGEINSIKTIEKFEVIAGNKNIIVKKISITSSNDIKLAMQKLVGLVDIIYVPQDNSVVSALDSVASIARAAKIPLISNDPNLVPQGVFMAYGANYYESGYQLGNMIADLLGGAEVKPLIQDTKNKELKINHKLAEEFNIKILKLIEEREKK